MPHRIYFDENEGDDRDRFDLGIPVSLADILPLAGQLSPGTRVTPYHDDTFELEAILEWDAAHEQWMARPLWKTIQRFDAVKSAPAAAK